MKTPMRRIRVIHFVGIGGVGMAGIAEVLLNLGYRVQGSDLSSNVLTQRLEGLGATIHSGHSADHVGDADVIVVSSAIASDNPEIVCAHERRLPVIRRAEMLAELMRFRFGIAVAGTHGKTTTTSLIASVLSEGGLDPTYFIGGRLASSDSNARLGAGEYLVAEADESDASFLHLQPMLAVVTNVDADHLSSYDNDFSKLKQGFVDFIHNLPFYGLAVVCADDPELQALVPKLGRPLLSYGFSEQADLRATNVRVTPWGSEFDVDREAEESFSVRLSLPGQHNIKNALAATAIGLELGVSIDAIRRALASFPGIDRRLERLGDVVTTAGTVTLVDDYGHHPTELRATLAAVRDSWPDRRLVAVFQPHRYSRTQELLDDFVRVLEGPDVLLLTEVYAAGESPIPNADGRSMARALRARGAEPVFVDDLSDLPAALLQVIRDGDVVVTLGAGSIGAVARDLPTKLRKPGPVPVASR